MYKTIFFKDEKLPFIESRFVKDSTNIYSEHFHDTLSIGAVEGGVTLYRCEGKEYELKIDSLAVINPDALHSCNPKDQSARTYHMLYLDIEWCKGLQSSIFKDTDSFISLKNVQIEDRNLYEEFISLNYTLLDEKVFYLEKEELLETFMIKLFKSHTDLSFKEANLTKAKEYVKKIKEYIDQNISQNITIDEISKYIGLSKFYIIKIFKQETNTTPYIYLLNKKIHRAKKLLSQDSDISQVALELGFYDQSHLNKVFKQYVASTPNEYKKNLRKK